MRLIGITGGIGTGKSTVSRILKDEYNIPVIYTDTLSRKIVEPGSKALDELVSFFGNNLLLPDGHMNRAYLRKITIHDREKMKIVTKIMWPAIAEEMQREMQSLSDSGFKIVCVENAILIESGNHNLYDEVVVVTCDPKIQLERVMVRDSQSEEDARAIINIQMQLHEKEKFATFLITNNLGIFELREQVAALYEYILKMN